MIEKWKANEWFDSVVLDCKIVVRIVVGFELFDRLKV